MKITINICCLAILLTGCTVAEITTGAKKSVDNIEYSVIYIIHADGDYLYFDDDGNSREGDQKVLAEARQIGEEAGNGEVFIFHQRPERKILGLFPQKDRRLMHYRSGKLIHTEKYSPGVTPTLFSAEADLYDKYRHGISPDSLQTYFFYFGHEIPEKNEKGYYQSMPTIKLGIPKFADALQQFRPSDTHKFDIAGLSTCNNGSPSMVHSLQSQTEYLLASPQNLHLSHIDTKKLNLLESRDGVTVENLATALAEDTFSRLSELQTAATISVYEMELIGDYISRLDSAYQANVNIGNSLSGDGNSDCAEIPFFRAFEDKGGVHSWYEAPGFGRKAGKKFHSGWGCRVDEETAY